MPKRASSGFVCPNCGADVEPGARACRECGSDDDTGWSPDTMYDGLDLPDPGYEGDDPHRSAASPGRGGRLYRIAAILLLLGAALALLTMLRSAL